LARAIAARPAGRALRRTSLGPLALEGPAIPNASAVGRWLKNHPEDSWQSLLDEAEALARSSRPKPEAKVPICRHFQTGVWEPVFGNRF
jgi:hypothetical protein